MASDRPFLSTVPYYVRYRLRYPRSLIEAVVQAARLDERARVLDLGCGPGFLAVGFARHVGEAVGMDPEPAMLAAAREEARKAGVRLTLVAGGSADVGLHLGRFRLVAMGRSFHWMDRARTLELLDPLIEPGGAVALFHARPPKGTANPWREAWNAVRERWETSSGRGRDNCGQYRSGEDTLRRSAFSCLHRVTQRYYHQASIEALIGRALSMSSTTPATLGDKRPAFEAELRNALMPFAVGGMIDEEVEAWALLAWRPAEAPAEHAARP